MLYAEFKAQRVQQLALRGQDLFANLVDDLLHSTRRHHPAGVRHRQGTNRACAL